MLTVNDLRRSFLDFFKEREHKIVASSSLQPKDDPTLLFTTAGMVQFKPMFAGTIDLEYTRAATVQKCLRTSDLENVGKTKRHCTFFEMLGNFSFGDYFKVEAIEYAWDYSIDVIGFPKDKIWISIFQDDDEAFEIWHKRIGVSKEKIVRLGKKDNFWGPAGDSGACGPCSELHYDRGESYGCGSKDCKPGCDCDRFLEYWNLVFNQFNQTVKGKLLPLPQTGIDTGMGLERLATLVQDVDSIYGIDELKSFVDFVSKKAGQKYNGENIAPINVIVEHARALTFAMSDGIYPSNDGRGYVLRRVLRRALRFSRQLGITEPFIYTVVDPIVKTMGEFYPEIKESKKNVKSVIESEEKRFLETIENGMDRLEEAMKDLKKKKEKTISGENAFLLYDTFGFPLEMTQEIAIENGLNVDLKSYDKEMQKQRERGKQSWKGNENIEKLFDDISREAGDTVFTGYEFDTTESKIKLLCNEKEKTKKLSKGDKGLVVLEKTPFYGESGGQVGDIGEINSDKGKFKVYNTKKHNNSTIHMGEVIDGEIKSGNKVRAEIDAINRNLICANHTATHLLQSALRNILGEHVKQSGSLVEPGRFRFDFSHFNAMSDNEIDKVESIVNEKIWENISLDTKVMNIDDAVKSGAMAVFDEKYEDVVRVVSIDNFSKELCGGTHVNRTGEIGMFKILKEASPGAGIRRIEAITLKGILDKYNEQEGIIKILMSSTGVTEDGIVSKVNDLIEKNKVLEKEMSKYKKENLSSEIDVMIKNAEDIKGTKIISYEFKDTQADELRSLSDSIRSNEQNSVVLFGSDNNGKPLLLFAATNKAVKNGVDCGKIIKDSAKIVGGGGGGRKDMAQAGGKSSDNLKKALNEAVSITKKMIQ